MDNSSISLNCQKIIKLSYVELKDFHIEVPEFQRIVSLHNVNEIVNFQLDHKRKKGYFFYLSTISLIVYNNKYYLCDGQHRYESIKQLYMDYGHNVEAFYEITKAENKEHVYSIFKLINKNTPLPDIEFESPSQKRMLKDICDYFQKNYMKIWSKAKDENRGSRRPHMSYNHFQKAIMFLLDNLNDKYTVNQYIEFIKNRNNIIKNRNLENLNNVTLKMKEKATSWDFYLGLYTFDEKKSYGYIWTKEIFENLEGVKPKSFYVIPDDCDNDENQVVKKYKKKKIPKSLRDKCWNTYVGETHSQCYCICCGSNIIKMQQYECGHIISEKDGGKINIENLMPICSTCNKSMGAQNMEIYIEEYHPEQLESFQNRNYTYIN